MVLLRCLLFLVIITRSAESFSTPLGSLPSPPPSAVILHQDPLVYTIPNLLSPQECNDYQEHVLKLQSQGRPMTRSNPPKVSVDQSKLWPLPILSFAAGIPSVIKTIMHQDNYTMVQIIQAASLPIAIALTFTIILVLVTPLFIQSISNQSARTSVAMALNQVEDIAFVTPLVDRIVDATGHDWYQWEAPVVTRYDPGAIFAKHGDASPTFGSEWKEEGGQRIITCICYLNSCPGGGGETYFDPLDIAVVPEPGKALVFYPANKTTLQADDRTTHESLPPVSDEKWIVQLFGRVGPRVPPPLGLPEEYGNVQTTRRNYQ